MFANQEDEDTIYPLATRQIVGTQKHDLTLNTMADKYDHTTQLVENIKVICKDGKMVIPASLQQRTVAWYHHYLQHPRNILLKEILCLSVY